MTLEQIEYAARLYRQLEGNKTALEMAVHAAKYAAEFGPARLSKRVAVIRMLRLASCAAHIARYTMQVRGL